MNIQPRIILSKEVSEDMVRHIFAENEWEVLYDKSTNTFTLIKKEQPK